MDTFQKLCDDLRKGKCGRLEAAQRIEELLTGQELLLAYWSGHDSAVAGVSLTWENALSGSSHKPGVMREPLETLYRRTWALREEITKLKKDLMLFT